MFAAGSILALLLTGFAVSGLAMADDGAEGDEPGPDTDPQDPQSPEESGAFEPLDASELTQFLFSDAEAPADIGADANESDTAGLTGTESPAEAAAEDATLDLIEIPLPPAVEGDEAPATIAGFDPATDRLILDFDAAPEDAPEISLDTEAAPGTTLVQANGHTVVILEGASVDDPGAVEVILHGAGAGTSDEDTPEPDATELPGQEPEAPFATHASASGPVDLDALLNGGSLDDMLQARAQMAPLLNGGADALTAAADGADITGGQRSDALFGCDGDDTLAGAGGHDELHGDRGGDLLDGGEGHDYLTGGEGADTLQGGEGADFLFGGDDDDVLAGGEGDDFLQGGFGSDTLDGGEGNDALDGTYSERSGALGTIDEDEGDLLNGGAGNDVLLLGAGDMAIGGDGADTFIGAIPADAEAAARIADFDRSEDRIEVFFDPGASPDPQVTVVDFDDGDGAHILLDGQIVLNVVGAQGLNPDEIGLKPWQAS